MSAVWLVAAAVAQSAPDQDSGSRPPSQQQAPAPQNQAQEPPAPQAQGQAQPQDQNGAPTAQQPGNQNVPHLNYPQSGAPDTDLQTDVQGNDQQGNDQQGEDPQAADPKASAKQPAAARVSMIHGDLSMQRADNAEWSAATLNTPLVRGDIVATGDRSRAEIQLDFANILRLSAHSQAKIADLTHSRIQVQIGEGYVSYSVFKGNEADVEIDTPNVAVHPLREGRYRIQVNSAEESEVIVREGEAEITTPQGSTTVHEGELITIRGVDNPEYKVTNAPGSDEWDRFNKDRDRNIRNADGLRRTNPYYAGAQDLDGHGRWVYIPGYGQVWQPYQQANWAPYQDGRWVWEPYYGWTWVSYEPWGWAPYHYGRWFIWGGSWVWWPGPVYAHYRPYWSPAFVTFIGFGRHGGFGFGSIGWIPCGPFDPFYPWYGGGFSSVTFINFGFGGGFHGRFIRPLGIRGRQPFISNTRLALTDSRVRGGITTVAAGDFGRGVRGSRGVSATDLRQGHTMTANLPVVPSRESLQTGGQAKLGGFQPRTQQRFFTQHQPPAGPAAFHDQQRQVQGVIQAHSGGAQVPARGGEAQQRSGGEAQSRGAEAGRGAETHTQPAIASRAGGPEGRGKSEAPATSGSTGAQAPAATHQQQPVENNSGRPASSAGAGRPAASTSGAGEQNRGGWTKFGPPSSGRAPSGDAGRPGASGSSMPATRPTTVPSQGSSKPTLQLNRPIVTPRNEGVRSGPPAASSPRPQVSTRPMNVPPASSRMPQARGGRSMPPPSAGPRGGGAPRGGSAPRSSGGGRSSSGNRSSSNSSSGSKHR
jgi:hypothetical protein